MKNDNHLALNFFAILLSICLASCSQSQKQQSPSQNKNEDTIQEDSSINISAKTSVQAKLDKIENNPNAPTSNRAEKNQQSSISPTEKKSAINYIEDNTTFEQQVIINDFCKKIDNRLSSISYANCLAANHRISLFKSVKGEPIVVTEFPPLPSRKPLGRVLIIGGTHGDELTSVSVAYKWIEKLNKYHSGLFHWHIAPVINPDGLFLRPATRTNANGVDINRNLPTSDWSKKSILRWVKSDRNPRKNPGIKAASEPETLWIINKIETFKPDMIISIHAPYGILDFDSPRLNLAPKKFGRLRLNLLGTYPGSLGNYAGIERNIPVLTLELPNAQYMSPEQETDAIWSDMISWLKDRLRDKNNNNS